MAELDAQSTNRNITHWIIHALYAIVLACGGFITSQIFGQLDKLEKIQDQNPFRYVQQDDYREDRKDLTETLRGISIKMSSDKQDIKEDYNRRSDKLEKLIIETIGSK